MKSENIKMSLNKFNSIIGAIFSGNFLKEVPQVCRRIKKHHTIDISFFFWDKFWDVVNMIKEKSVFAPNLSSFYVNIHQQKRFNEEGEQAINKHQTQQFTEQDEKEEKKSREF